MPDKRQLKDMTEGEFEELVQDVLGFRLKGFMTTEDAAEQSPAIRRTSIFKKYHVEYYCKDGEIEGLRAWQKIQGLATKFFETRLTIRGGALSNAFCRNTDDLSIAQWFLDHDFDVWKGIE